MVDEKCDFCDCWFTVDIPFDYDVAKMCPECKEELKDK